jgi:two-component system, LuxR family, sensor kinase FixL
MNDLLSIYAPRHRNALLFLAGILIIAIATIDFATQPYISLGFLYLFPIMIVGGFLSRTQTLVVALICAGLQEVFSNLPENQAVVRLVLSSTGFAGTGLFISELIRNRQIVLRHVEELEDQITLRKDAEEQLHFLVESSPAAIVTIDSTGSIILTNEAAQQLLAPGAEPLAGQTIRSYLPSLQTVVQTHLSRAFRTTLQCRGQRSTGEAFLAGVWFSTYTTLAGPRLAAIVVDLSEDLRNREDLSLEHLLKSTRILMSAVAHEMRNLCGAALAIQKNLSRIKELDENEDFRALSTLIESLEKVVALELQPSPALVTIAVELTSVFDELRVLIDTAFSESAMEIEWLVEDTLPLVLADRYGLIQVFLNLAKNSQRAMQTTATKRLRVSTVEEAGTVTIRFEDTGVGVGSPEYLFRPFQPGAASTGLGLYVSRAIMRSFAGDLRYEARSEGCCFAVVLPVAAVEATVNA